MSLEQLRMNYNKIFFNFVGTIFYVLATGDASKITETRAHGKLWKFQNF